MNSLQRLQVNPLISIFWYRSRLLHGEEEIERRLKIAEKREKGKRERGSLTLVLKLRVENKQG